MSDNLTPTIKPFLGRLKVEAMLQDTEEFLRKKMGMENSVLALPESVTKKGTVPLTKAKVIEMAPDAFGEKFQNNNGHDIGDTPDVGDIVYFVPNETYAIDPERKYHLVNDCDIVGFEKAP